MDSATLARPEATSIPEPLADANVLPPDAARRVRDALGMPANAPLRIAFVAGPGDAVGTFDHWSKGVHDPRMPVINYTTMLYSLIQALDAQALILVEQDKQPAAPNQNFRFAFTPRRRTGKHLAYRLDERAFTRVVLRQLRDYRPDVIIVGTDAPDGLIAGLPGAKRVVLTAHNTYWPMGHRPTTPKERLKLWIKARSLRRVDVAVCTSDECAVQIAALGGPSGARSFTEVPQILPAFYPSAVPRRRHAQKLLFVGRVEENKGVFDLLQAFEAVAAEHAELTLEIAGSGSAVEPLVAAIAASPHADRITFHGQLLARAVHERLAAADLLVCPTRSSFNEGLALVVAEAAVHGVPTLLSSIVPAKALVPKGCAQFPVDDTSALTEALRHLVSSPAEYRALCDELAERRGQFRDRSRSWGTMLYRALAV